MDLGIMCNLGYRFLGCFAGVWLDEDIWIRI